MPSWKSKVLLAKAESSYGVDAVPTGAANAILFTADDFAISPMEGQDIDRNLEMPWFGASEMIPVGLHQKITFSVGLTGSGAAGTAPAFGVLLRGCAMAATVTTGVSVAYSPITSGIESLSFYVWIDGTRYVLRGSQGTFELGLDANALPVLKFTFWGLFQAATDVAQPTPALASQIAVKPRPGSSANTPTFTVGGVSLALRSFSLDAGVAVEPRILIRRESIMVTDRAERINATVEATDLATLNPYQLALNATPVAVSLTHGTTAGNIVQLAAPACQLMRQTGLGQSQNIVEWPLSLVPIPQSGNDQFTLTFR